ncbi:MAG: O-antigen ligase family protein [Janthinobacterium lividum]
MTIPGYVHRGSYAWEEGMRPGVQIADGRIAAWYQGGVLALVCAVLFANLPLYAYVLRPGLLPKYQYVALFLLMLPLVPACRRQLPCYLVSPFVLWASLLLLVNLVHLASLTSGGQVGGTLLIDNRMEARRALVEVRMQYILFAMALGFAVHASSAAARRIALRVMVVLAVLLPCAVIADFLRPGLFYAPDTPGTVVGRAAAVYLNPTMAGEVLLLLCLFACLAVPMRWRAPLLLLAGAAVLTTFSRSAILAWILVLGILATCRSLPKSALAVGALAIGAALLGFGMFESYLLSRSDFEGAAAGNILARLDFFSNFSLGDDSAAERSEVLRSGWELFLQNPVFGAGAGATQFWEHRGGTHNQLLMFAAEYGCFGVGLWAWMAAILWRGRLFEDTGLRLALVALYLTMSMFTHLMLDVETFWLASFALAAAGRPDASSAVRRRIHGASGPDHPPLGLAPFAWSYEALEAVRHQKRLGT